jgi:HK97 gp10 family phage protein
MMAISFESRIEQAKEKIKEKPQMALKEIGKVMVREIKKNAAKGNKTRIYYKDGRKFTIKPGRLRKSIGYWFRKKEGDLQIGSKAFYAVWEEKGSSKNSSRPFLEKTIMQNVSVIQEMIMDALKELTSKRLQLI